MAVTAMNVLSFLSTRALLLARPQACEGDSLLPLPLSDIFEF